MSERDGIQVAIGEPAGLRGSLYDIWFGAKDVYLGASSLVSDWKTSIHYERSDRPGRVRYFLEFRRAAGQRTPSVRKRGSKAVEPRTATFHSLAAGTNCRPRNGNKSHIRPADPFRSPASTRRRRARPAGTERVLANGRMIWLIQHEIPAPDEESMKIMKQGLANRFSAAARARPEFKSQTGRLIAAMDCGDGSGAFAEFAAATLLHP